MQKKRSRTNHYHFSKQSQQERINRKTSSSQKVNMGKYSLTKSRHSHQSNILRPKQETTLIFNQIEHGNTTIRLKHRTNTSFRPLAASTPYDIEQSNLFNQRSPHSLTRHQRVSLTPPMHCSTPKPIRRQISNQSHGRSTSSSLKQKLLLEQQPSVPLISQRRLQFTPHSHSFVRYSNDETKRINIPNIKIWLL